MWSEADLGDKRRKHALVAVTAGLISKPRGRISQAFAASKAREQAYGFVENPRVEPEALSRALSKGCRHAVARTRVANVILDGTSLKLADPHGMKDFGQVGAHTKGARGLKVITGYCVDDTGTPIGIAGQRYWARAKRERRGPKSMDNKRRKTCDKETQRWLDVIDAADKGLAASNLRFIVDREGDSQAILQTLLATGKAFVVRSSHNRRLVSTTTRKRHYVRNVMPRARSFGTYTVDIPAGEGRQARRATLVVRAKPIRVLLRDRWKKTATEISLSAVYAREKGTTPTNEKPLDWLLLTNQPVSRRDEVLDVISAYRLRWRIEDFHKAWKSGHCNVEDMQLHSMRAATIFAIMHAGIAARVERLKHLARTTPETPASSEISKDEHRALQAMVEVEFNRAPAPGGRRQKVYRVSDYDQLMLGEAVDWIARLGGYTGKSSGGPPGTATLGRGLELLTYSARLLSSLGKTQRRDQ